MKDGNKVIKIKDHIKYFADDGNGESKYYFEVGLIIDENDLMVDGVLSRKLGTTQKAKASFAPGFKDELPILIFKETDDKTIYHECTHLTINFFKHLEMSFDKMFGDEFGEELFIHYLETFFREVKQWLAYLKEKGGETK